MRRAGNDKGRLLKALQDFLDGDAVAIAARAPKFGAARQLATNAELHISHADWRTCADIIGQDAFLLTKVARHCTALDSP